jgi:hypothetical protein
LNVGLRWHVGNGESIHIWRDKWLPRPSTYRVISPPRILSESATMDQLINSETMTWDKDLISRIFCSQDVEVILSIPLSCRRPRDSLTWCGTRNGSFTVKSAYYMLISRNQSQEASSSSGEDLSRLWIGVWSAAVSPKVRLFIWKACRGILPTKERLFVSTFMNGFPCYSSQLRNLYLNYTMILI